MKKILLATTALIAAGVFASPAQANLEVTVGGYAAFQAAMFDNDRANDSGRDFQSEAQILISADATADNGLQYGAKVLLDASSNDTGNTDEVGIYLAGSFGRVEMGDDDGASEMAVFAPTVGIGQINGSYDDYLLAAARGHELNDRGDHNFTSIDTDDSTKITYYTPKYNGVQFGMSYAPEISTGEAVTFLKNVADSSDNFEFGLGYDGEVSGVQVMAGATYVMGEANVGLEDISSWTVGAKLGYKGFSFGGGYTDDGDSLETAGFDNDEISSWNIGATYEQGPWGVGVSYLDKDFNTNGESLGVNGGTFSVVALGGTYKVAPGLTVGADLAFFDRDSAGTANDIDGYVFVTDVTAAF